MQKQKTHQMTVIMLMDKTCTSGWLWNFLIFFLKHFQCPDSILLTRNNLYLFKAADVGILLNLVSV